MSRYQRGVRIWHIPLDPGPAVVARCLDLLDDAERAQLSRVASPELARRYAVAHGAVREVLGALVSAGPAGLRYRTGQWGKPELDGYPGVHHNLSHSDELALLAVSADQAVGVDVERLRPSLRGRALADRYFLPAEARAVARRPAADQPWWYQRFWTRKEACGKVYGVPLVVALRFGVHGQTVPPPVGGDRGRAAELVGAAPSQRSPCRLVDVTTEPGYLAAVAMLGAGPYQVHHHRWRR